MPGDDAAGLAISEKMRARIVGLDAAADNQIFNVSYADGTKLNLQQRQAVKDTTDMSTIEGLLDHVAITAGSPGTSLVLQIGDTSDKSNQLEVSIRNMRVSAMGAKSAEPLSAISIDTQEAAWSAMETIRDAINYASNVRGSLGAIYNRLEHTANNLSVSKENLSRAESTIRDTDIANLMMTCTKDSILIQSSQAMLAQGNQVSQGVLRLLD